MHGLTGVLEADGRLHSIQLREPGSAAPQGAQLVPVARHPDVDLRRPHVLRYDPETREARPEYRLSVDEARTRVVAALVAGRTPDPAAVAVVQAEEERLAKRERSEARSTL